MADFQSIQPLWSDMPMTVSSPEKTKSAVMENPFTDIFRSAIASVKETDAEKTELEYLMATGQLDNPSLLTIASDKADSAVTLLVQLRNRALDAYNELMRISL